MSSEPHTYKTENGDFYMVREVEMKTGKKIEKGTIKFANGDIYEGDWSQGAKNGYGKYQCANGVVFDGRWKDDARHGYIFCSKIPCKTHFCSRCQLWGLHIL